MKTKLHNPYLLVAQGFVAGAVLFFATTPRHNDRLLAETAPAAQNIGR